MSERTSGNGYSHPHPLLNQPTLIYFAPSSLGAAFNLVIPSFWLVTGVMLFMLVRSFVDDEDKVQYNLGLFAVNNRSSGYNKTKNTAQNVKEIEMQKLIRSNSMEADGDGLGGAGSLVSDGVRDIISVFNMKNMNMKSETLQNSSSFV